MPGNSPRDATRRWLLSNSNLPIATSAQSHPSEARADVLKNGMSGRHIYLVPGFFGFSALGDLNYFHKVADTLGEALSERGLEAQLFDCTTKPTASITRRADWVLSEMVERCRELKLRLASDEADTKRDVMILLTVQTMNFLHEGHHRVAL